MGRECSARVAAQRRDKRECLAWLGESEMCRPAVTVNSAILPMLVSKSHTIPANCCRRDVAFGAGIGAGDRRGRQRRQGSSRVRRHWRRQATWPAQLAAVSFTADPGKHTCDERCTNRSSGQGADQPDLREPDTAAVTIVDSPLFIIAASGPAQPCPRVQSAPLPNGSACSREPCPLAALGRRLGLAVMGSWAVGCRGPDRANLVGFSTIFGPVGPVGRREAWPLSSRVGIRARLSSVTSTAQRSMMNAIAALPVGMG